MCVKVNNFTEIYSMAMNRGFHEYYLLLFILFIITYTILAWISPNSIDNVA